MIFQPWTAGRNSSSCSPKPSSRSARPLTASRRSSSQRPKGFSSTHHSRTYRASSWSPSTTGRRARQSCTLCAPAGASPSRLSTASTTSTATSLTTASRPRKAHPRSTVSSALRRCIHLSCAAVWLLFVLRSFVLWHLEAASSICGSAVLALVSCSIWVFKQRPKALCTPTFMSTSLLQF